MRWRHHLIQEVGGMIIWCRHEVGNCTISVHDKWITVWGGKLGGRRACDSFGGKKQWPGVDSRVLRSRVDRGRDVQFYNRPRKGTGMR